MRIIHKVTDQMCDQVSQLMKNRLQVADKFYIKNKWYRFLIKYWHPIIYYFDQYKQKR